MSAIVKSPIWCYSLHNKLICVWADRTWSGARRTPLQLPQVEEIGMWLGDQGQKDHSIPPAHQLDGGAVQPEPQAGYPRHLRRWTGPGGKGSRPNITGMPGQKTRRRRRMQKATTTRNTRPDSRSFKSATTPTDGSGSQPRHKSGAQPDHRGSRQHHIQTRPSRLEAGKDQTHPPTTLRGPSQQSQRGSSMRGT